MGAEMENDKCIDGALSVRPMELSDVEAVAALEQEAFAVPWSAGILRAGLQSDLDLFYVLELDGNLCGYGAMRILLDEGELLRIAVALAFRRRGLAKFLMDRMMEDAKERGVTAYTLEVRESNCGARRLYESYGFLEEAVRKDYYSNPKEDAIIMWRRQ